MLTGKKYPMNLRALRMVVEELLQNKVASFSQYSELEMFPETVSGNSLLTKHWVENLIKPLFICLLLVTAQREGEGLLHLAAVKNMLPYFYAAGHHYCARYGSYYLRNMEKLPQEVLPKFIKGEHVMRHQQGYWNSIWSDIYICRNNFRVLWKGPRRHCWINFKVRSC